jgi:hypothetical protein
MRYQVGDVVAYTAWRSGRRIQGVVTRAWDLKWDGNQGITINGRASFIPAQSPRMSLEFIARPRVYRLNSVGPC